MPAPRKTPEMHKRDIEAYAKEMDVKLENVIVTCVDFAKRKWKYEWTYQEEPHKTSDKVCVWRALRML